MIQRAIRRDSIDDGLKAVVASLRRRLQPR
jgi:hypothetical protein